VATRRGLARFVGRHSELEHLKKTLALAKAGHGQIVGVMGEPGVGKSRLFHEFKFFFQKNDLMLETFSISHGKAHPLFAFDRSIEELLSIYAWFTEGFNTADLQDAKTLLEELGTKQQGGQKSPRRKTIVKPKGSNKKKR
jgi:predicted ATPase